MSLYCWRKLESLEEIHADTGRRDNSQMQLSWQK
uniref:Uncharacterized protein n=1 Tax=Anguilla anguilla TaxID=7936 RepID=A0A0E9TJU3_ANGAN